MMILTNRLVLKASNDMVIDVINLNCGPTKYEAVAKQLNAAFAAVGAKLIAKVENRG
jgi:energy-converting hydrogenase Eha subunit E